MNLFAKWKDKLTHYVDVRLNLLKLGFIERTSNVLGFVILTFMLLFLAVTVLIFLGIGIQECIAVWLDSRIAASFLTCLFFILLMGVLVGMRKYIVAIFAGMFVRILTDGKDDDEDEIAGAKIKIED